MYQITDNRTSRIEWIDLSKGFCIILVVLFHACKMTSMTYPLWVQTSSFRMPLYFILSGLFFKRYESFNGFLKRKTNKLLIPFLFFLLFTSVLPFALKNNSSSLPVLFKYREIIYNLPIWFLLCLFEINLLFYLIHLIIDSFFTKHTKEKTALTIGISVILGFGGMYLGYIDIKLPLYLDTSLSALPFFVFGWWLNRKTSFLKSPSRPLDMLIIVGCIIIVCLFAVPVEWMENMYSLKSIWAAYPCGISGTLMILLIAKFFNHLPLISFWGRYSIIILCTHYPIGIVTVNFLQKYYTGIPLLLITMLISITVCHFLIFIMKKYFPHVTAQKDLIPIDS